MALLGPHLLRISETYCSPDHKGWYWLCTCTFVAIYHYCMITSTSDRRMVFNSILCIWWTVPCWTCAARSTVWPELCHCQIPTSADFKSSSSAHRLHLTCYGLRYVQWKVVDPGFASSGCSHGLSILGFGVRAQYSITAFDAPFTHRPYW